MAKEESKKVTGFSCGVASLLLRGMPLHETIYSMHEQQKEAIGHYLNCERCGARGIADILDIKMSCQEVLTVLAEHPSASSFNFFRDLSPNVQTLNKIYAIEHIFGKAKKVSDHLFYTVYNGFGCKNSACWQVAQRWYERREKDYEYGPVADLQELPFFIGIFNQNSWPIDKLIIIRKQRLNEVYQECIKLKQN